MKRRIIPAVLSVSLCQLAGLLGSLFTAPAIPAWYASLNKPVFSPPNWLFGSVWTVLYTLMGIAASLVWSQGVAKRRVKQALIIFAIQLILNTLWSIIFFGLKSPLLALIEIMILWYFIILTTLKFIKISKAAGFLLIPYFLWVSFAAFLNFSIYLLNR